MTQRGVELLCVPVAERQVGAEPTTAVVKLSSWLQKLETPTAQAELLLPYADWFNFSDATLNSPAVQGAFVVAREMHGDEPRKHKPLPYIFHNLAYLSVASKLHELEEIRVKNTPNLERYLATHEWDILKVVALTHDILEKFLKANRRLTPVALCNRLVVKGVPPDIASDAIAINHFLTPISAHLPDDGRNPNTPAAVQDWLQEKYDDAMVPMRAPGRQGWIARFGKGIDILANLWDTIDDIGPMKVEPGKPLIYLKRGIEHYVPMYRARVSLLSVAGLPPELMQELIGGYNQLEALVAQKMIQQAGLPPSI